jgi:hypothetical protein
MYIFHFCADFDCSVSINGALAGVLNADKDLISIKVCDIESFVVSVLPLQSQTNITLLPYAFNVKPHGHIINDSKFTITTIYPESNIEIKLKPNILDKYEPPEILKQQTVQGNILITVYQDSSCRIMLENNKLLLSHTIGKRIANIQIELLNYEDFSYLKIEGNTEDNKKYLLLISMHSYCVMREFTADKIEINSGVVEVLNNYDDMARHGIVTKYKLDDMTKELENYIVYTEENVPVPECEELIPYAFFEAVKIKNFNLARKFLSADLMQILDDQHINEFFGSFDEITYNKYASNNKNTIALIYGEQIKHIQIYKVTIFDNLIENIELV